MELVAFLVLWFVACVLCVCLFALSLGVVERLFSSVCVSLPGHR